MNTPDADRLGPDTMQILLGDVPLTLDRDVGLWLLQHGHKYQAEINRCLRELMESLTD